MIDIDIIKEKIAKIHSDHELDCQLMESEGIRIDDKSGEFADKLVEEFAKFIKEITK